MGCLSGKTRSQPSNETCDLILRQRKTIPEQLLGHFDDLRLRRIHVFHTNAPIEKDVVGDHLN